MGEIHLEFLPSPQRLSENLESSLAFLKGDYNMFIGGKFKECFCCQLYLRKLILFDRYF